MRSCPICDAPDPIYHPAEHDDEHGEWECPDCGWTVGDDQG